MEPAAEPAALLNDYPRMRLLLFLLSCSALSNSYIASFSTAFPFYGFFFCSKLLPPASLILSLPFFTANTPPPTCLSARLYRAALYMGPVAAVASHSLLVPDC